MAGPGQPLPGPSPMGPIGESTGPVVGRGIGPSLRSELASLPRPPQQVVYVFTTSLANRAAEAVIHGHADSILLFHQKTVTRTKLDQCVSGGKLPGLSEQLSSGSTPPTGTPKSQSGTPRPASVGGGAGGHLHSAGTPSSTGHPEDEALQARPGGAPNSNSGGPGPHPLGPTLRREGAAREARTGRDCWPRRAPGLPVPQPRGDPCTPPGGAGGGRGRGARRGCPRSSWSTGSGLCRRCATSRDCCCGGWRGCRGPGGPNGNPGGPGANGNALGGVGAAAWTATPARRQPRELQQQ
ncbi:hypothetical protein ANANG_G00163750 [Anguilla anguilla]|uniref:Uncharacterized protein n=1 Tax=Anguilla anguilla TaxID=7936 RepID=A0A9D3RZ48_ANGAN|nr:hypothetical protein ANANG_G00163750 [Anguilla anguilla]